MPDANLPTQYPIGTPTVNTKGVTRRVRDLQAQLNDKPNIELVEVIDVFTSSLTIRKIGTTTDIAGVVYIGWAGAQHPEIGELVWALTPEPGATPIAIGVPNPTQPRCKVWLNTDVLVATNTTPGVKYAFDSVWTEEYKELVTHSSVTNNTRLTILREGLYIIHGQSTFEANGAGQRGNGLMLNNTMLVQPFDTAPNGLIDSVVWFTIPLYLSPNDYLEMAFVQNSGGNLNIKGGPAKTFLSVIRVAY